MKLRATLSLLCLFLVPVSGWASEIFWPGYALEAAVSNSCTRTAVTGTNHGYTVMDCTESGTQQFIVHGQVNPDASTTYRVEIYWYSSSATTDNVCWTVETAVLPAGVISTADYTALTFGNSKSSDPLANAGSNMLRNSVFASDGNLYNYVTGATCSGSTCDQEPLAIRISRNNSGSCTGNLAATVRVVGVRIIF